MELKMDDDLLLATPNPASLKTIMDQTVLEN